MFTHVHKEVSEIGENTMIHCYEDEEGRRKEERTKWYL